MILGILVVLFSFLVDVFSLVLLFKELKKGMYLQYYQTPVLKVAGLFVFNVLAPLLTTYTIINFNTLFLS